MQKNAWENRLHRKSYIASAAGGSYPFNYFRRCRSPSPQRMSKSRRSAAEDGARGEGQLEGAVASFLN
jgi:hypothetical protein